MAERLMHVRITSHFQTLTLWMTAWGTIASATVVVALTKAGPGPGVITPDGPFGIWRATAEGQMFWSITAMVATALLALAFVQLYRLARRRMADVRCVTIVSAAWAAPLLIGPPLLSLDVYSYLAQGHLVTLGLDPYTTAPIVLGHGPVLEAVAPVWRMTPAPYGPLSLGLLGWLAEFTQAGHVPFILLLRLLTVISVVAGGWAAVRLSRPGSRTVALTLVAANPVVSLHLIGGLHLDVLIGVLAAVALLAVRRQWWWLAALAAALAFAIKLPGLVLVGYVLLARFHRRAARWLRGSLEVLAITVGTVSVCSAMVPDGWGWLATLDTPGTYNQPYAAPSLLAEFGHRVIDAAGANVRFDDVLTSARIGTMAAGAVVILVLLLRARQPSNVRHSGALVGGGLATVAIAAPVIHPWYLSWGLVLVAACAGVPARRWLVAATVIASFTAIPHPLVDTTHGVAFIVALLVTTMGITVWWLVKYDREHTSDASRPTRPRLVGRRPVDQARGRRPAKPRSRRWYQAMSGSPSSQHSSTGSPSNSAGKSSRSGARPFTSAPDSCSSVTSSSSRACAAFSSGLPPSCVDGPPCST